MSVNQAKLKVRRSSRFTFSPNYYYQTTSTVFFAMHKNWQKFRFHNSSDPK